IPRPLMYALFPYTTLFRSMSHGNKRDGYVVYMKDGKVYFQVNQKGQKTILKTADALPETFKVKASLLSGGKMTLSIDDKQVAERSEEHTSELQSRENLVCR